MLTLTLTPIAGFAVAFALAYLLTPLASRVAAHFGAVDWKSTTKIHARDMPRLGGIAIAAGFYVPVLVLALRWNLFRAAVYEQPERVAALLGGALVILGLGIYDDLRGATALKKLAVQIPVAVVAWWLGVRIGGTSGPSGIFLSFAPAVSLAATVLWLLVAINAVNLIDGLDGLASGIALQALAATALCAWYRGEPVLALFAIILAGTVAGFLIHNFHPATIYMGDSGSMFLGYVLGVAAVWSSQKSATAVGMVLPALVLGVPLLDTSLAVWRRVLAGRPVMSGDLDHMHHRLLNFGWSYRRTVFVLYTVGFFFSALSVLLVFVNDRRLGLPVLAVAVAVAIGLAVWLGYHRPRR